MKVKLWVFVTALLFITAIYPAALYLSIQRYNAWKQDLIAWYEAKGIPSGYIDVPPYIGTREASFLITLAAILASCWLLIITKHGKKMKPVILMVT